MAKLYEISLALAAILHGDDDGEINDDTGDRLTELEMDFNAKVEGVLQYRQSLLADATALKAEADRLKGRADAFARRAEWLKGYVHNAMTQIGVGKVSTLTFTATVAKSPFKVEQTGDEIPAQYKREEVIVSLNKAKVLEDFKAGKTLPEGLSVVQGTNLRVS